MNDVILRVRVADAKDVLVEPHFRVRLGEKAQMTYGDDAANSAMAVLVTRGDREHAYLVKVEYTEGEAAGRVPQEAHFLVALDVPAEMKTTDAQGQERTFSVLLQRPPVPGASEPGVGLPVRG